MASATGGGETRALEAAGSVRQGLATGDARVDDALARLDELADLPVAEHPAVFEYVHERLAEALGDLEPGDHGRPRSPHGREGPDARHGGGDADRRGRPGAPGR